MFAIMFISGEECVLWSQTDRIQNPLDDSTGLWPQRTYITLLKKEGETFISEEWWQIAFSKDGRNSISQPRGLLTLTLQQLHQHMETKSPPLESAWVCEPSHKQDIAEVMLCDFWEWVRKSHAASSQVTWDAHSGTQAPCCEEPKQCKRRHRWREIESPSPQPSWATSTHLAVGRMRHVTVGIVQ